MSFRSISTYEDRVPVEEDDAWGLFVDTEEQDAELIRHSKVLSRRESLFR